MKYHKGHLHKNSIKPEDRNEEIILAQSTKTKTAAVNKFEITIKL